MFFTKANGADDRRSVARLWARLADEQHSATPRDGAIMRYASESTIRESYTSVARAMRKRRGRVDDTRAMVAECATIRDLHASEPVRNSGSTKRSSLTIRLRFLVSR